MLPKTPMSTFCHQEEALQKWYEKYSAIDGNVLSKDNAVLQELEADKLDLELVEKCVHESARDIHISAEGFCSSCQNLFAKWPELVPPGQKPDWQHTIGRACHTIELEAATRNGCRFCGFLMQRLKDCELLVIFRKIEARITHLNKTGTSSLSIQVWGNGGSLILWLNLPGKRPRDVLDIATDWLRRCSESHGECVGQKHTVLPTRLVSVSDNVVRLVLTQGWDTKLRYSTLSHRWGDTEFLKLTTANLDPFLAEVPADLLPKIFSEAIKITRRLGLKHIWIDSLCILQDDSRDWQREAAMMSSVYGGSSINIAASSATNVHQSCFSRPPYFSGGLRARVTVNGTQCVRDFRTSDEYERSITGSHLATRAWALQEKALPLRTIHLGERGAFWECRTKTANESLPGGFPNQLARPLISGFKKQMQYTDSWWTDIVRLYSRTNMTFPEDKLPALSGVAGLVYNKTGDGYLAGMWKSNFEAQMCWMAQAPGKRPPSWRSPTWSWSSLDGGLGYHHVARARRPDCEQDGYAHLLDTKIALRGPDPFGQVTAGTIRIGCSSLLVGHFSLPETIRIVYNDDSLDIHVRRDSFDDGGCDSGDVVYLLPILGGKTGSASMIKGEQRIWEYALNGVLLRQTGAAAGCFNRVGAFVVHQDPVGKGPHVIEPNHYRPLVQLLEKEGQRTAETICAEVIDHLDHPEEKFVVYIS
ncbi:MAG: hypothetical protein Q9160_003383 [Pyrenula sp. 1 TL-2023]